MMCQEKDWEVVEGESDHYLKMGLCTDHDLTVQYYQTRRSSLGVVHARCGREMFQSRTRFLPCPGRWACINDLTWSGAQTQTQTQPAEMSLEFMAKAATKICNVHASKP